jgi:hypothetical protein
LLNMQDALLPPSLPPIAPRRPLCCSCSFGTPRPAPEFESRGERERLSAFSLSYVRPRVPAFHAPAPGRSGDAAGLRTNMYKHRTLHNSALAPARFGIRPSSTATGARQHNAGGRGGWGGGAGRGVAVFVRSQVPRMCADVVCTPAGGRFSCLHRPLARRRAALLHDAGGYRSHGSTRRKSTPVCVCRAVGSAAAVRSGYVTGLLRSSFCEVGRSAGSERDAQRQESALADARVITPKGLNLGAGLVPGGRGRAAADGDRSATPNSSDNSRGNKASWVFFNLEFNRQLTLASALCARASSVQKHS